MKILPCAFTAILSLAAVGCGSSIGDSCSTSNDCPSGTICDTDSPSGYCLVPGCEMDEECPENATCVKFTKNIHYCLKKCKKDGDCRSKYACRHDLGDTGFCYVAPDYVYGRVGDNRVDFSVRTPRDANPEDQTP